MSTLRSAIAALVDEPGMDVCSCQACASTLDAFTIAIYRAGIIRGREEAEGCCDMCGGTNRNVIALPLVSGGSGQPDVPQEGACHGTCADIRALPAPAVTLDSEIDA